MAKKKSKNKKKQSVTVNPSSDIVNNDKSIINDENNINISESSNISNQDTKSNNITDDKDTIVSSKTTSFDKLKKHITKRNIIVIFISILISLVIMFVLFPLTKNSAAKNYIKNGEYEEAINSLNIISFSPSTNKIKDEAMRFIAERSAKELVNKSTKLNPFNLELDGVTNYDCIISDNSEEVVFDASYSNKNFSINIKGKTKNIFKQGKWEIEDYDILSSNYEIFVECDKLIIDKTVLREYPGASFDKESNSDSLYKNYIYKYRNNDDNPFYYSNYDLYVLCIFNVDKNEWFVSDIRKIKTSDELIPLKEFKTSIFSINLPEAWIMKASEEYYHYSYNGDHENYDYSYIWWANDQTLEDFYGGNTKDGYSKSIFEIYVYFGDSSNSYKHEDNYTASYLGKGSINENTYINGYYGYFNPKIKNYSSNFRINGYYLDETTFKNTVDSIKLKNTVYDIEVLVKNLNIRDYPSTNYGKVVGHITKGKKTEAYRFTDRDEYRWYCIGENQWIADLNGEYLKINYR